MTKSDWINTHQIFMEPGGTYRISARFEQAALDVK
jgi:hypothetical protein